MTIARLFIAVSLCFITVACGDSGEENPPCMYPQPCMQGGDDPLDLDVENGFTVEIDDIFPDIASDKVLEEAQMEGSDEESECPECESGPPFRRDPCISNPLVDLDSEKSEEARTMAEKVVSVCNEVAKQVIDDCQRAKRSVPGCGLRGSWVYSGCIDEMSEDE